MDHNTSRSRQHALLMILCCLVPVAAVGAIFVLKIPAPRVLSHGLILLCPLSHVLMMALMGHGQHDHRTNANAQPGVATNVVQTPGKG